MGKKRVQHSAEFKGKVALEALKGVKTVNELAGEYQIHPTQISQWKWKLLPNMDRPNVELSGTIDPGGSHENVSI
jgi:transposase-like protein